MEQFKNYNKVQLTIDLVKANIFALVLFIPVIILYVVPFALIWGKEPLLTNWDTYAILAFPVMIGGTVLHEFIHGATWYPFTKNGFRSIKFGVLWKMLTPYCHCKEPLKVSQYMLGAIMPAILLGFLPAIVAIAIGSFGLLLFAILFTAAAAGDFMIIDLVRKEAADNYVLDHPSEAGCYVYRKE